MKKFLKKILLYLFIYLVISKIIFLFIPYHWGNPWYSSKIRYLENNKKYNYNTYFFGSSRIYRQINPIEFDSVFNEKFKGENIKSFNLGAPATFPPQSYYLYENFLESNLANDVRYCFLELDNISDINDDLMHQERSNYWLNLDYLIFTSKYFLEEKGSFLNRIKDATDYYVSYLENSFHYGHFGESLTDHNYYKDFYVGPNNRGNLTLDYNLNMTNNLKTKKGLIKRRNKLIDNPDKLKYIKSKSKKENLNYDKSYVNSSHLERINNLIFKSKLKNIKLFFIISPRNVDNKILSLGNEIPKKNLIDMSDPEKYPKLYDIINSFDFTHLNEKGSTIYSRKLGNSFFRIIN